MWLFEFNTGHPAKDYEAAVEAREAEATPETMRYHNQRVRAYRMSLLSWIALGGSLHVSYLRRGLYAHLMGLEDPFVQMERISEEWDDIGDEVMDFGPGGPCGR